MNDTHLRESLAVVSDAVAVPVPDAHAFDARVRRVRRRRTASRVVTASVAVAGVALGTSLLLADTGPSTVPDPSTPPPVVPAGLPVLVEGRLTTLADDGSLGDPGPKVARIVGSSADGVVVFAMNGDLARVTADGEVRRLVDEPVRRAYVDEGGVVLQTFDGLVRWIATDRDTDRDSLRTDGMLIAAAQGSFVIAGEGGGSGLVAHDPEGEYELPLGSDGASEVVQQVEIGGARIAVHTQAGVEFFEDRGARSAGLLGGGTGALSPDGEVYAMAPNGADLSIGARPGLRLVDPHTGSASRVRGPEGPAVDLLWTDASTLLVVTGDARSRTLWRCTDTGRSCAVLAEDPTGSLELPVA